MNAEKPSVAPNVDHNEIAKFEAVASRWWDLEGEFKPLHRINPLRLGYIAERSGGKTARAGERRSGRVRAGDRRRACGEARPAVRRRHLYGDARARP